MANGKTPTQSPTVVVALDQATYETPPFRGTPTVVWTREIGKVLTAVVDAGAAVVGFDLIFPSSIEESDLPFGQETFGSHNRGFDRDFLRALGIAARTGKVVLAEIQRGNDSISPAAGQRVAVGGPHNIRAINVLVDPDGVVRRVPLLVSDGTTPAMALELASRALGVAPEVKDHMSVSLQGYRLPQSGSNALTLNFRGGSNDIPTYSFADLHSCLERGNAEFFRRHFEGKIVLFGSALDFQDRKLTSKRFATAPEKLGTERCVVTPAKTEPIVSSSIDGVYIHATAINNLLRRDAVEEWPPLLGAFAVFGGASIAAISALLLGPGLAGLTILSGIVAWTVASVVAFHGAVAMPLLQPIAGALIALPSTIAYRLFVIDKEWRFLRRAFALYLAPRVIDALVASGKPPVLGGEIRTVTIFYSDVSDFSLLAETMNPSILVSLMNCYFSAMTEVIEAHGGFVDKYVGDAIVAIFGAPATEMNHALRAIQTALCCEEKLKELNQSGNLPRGIKHRIGLNTGKALVGNIGSNRRFNYTAMGHTVNIASRLEEANKIFGTTIITSQATMEHAAIMFIWRELDSIRVKGQMLQLRVFEPVCEAGKQTPEQIAGLESYSRGLLHWRNADFESSAQSFALSAECDLPSALFMKRAMALSATSPAPNWDPAISTEK